MRQCGRCFEELRQGLVASCTCVIEDWSDFPPDEFMRGQQLQGGLTVLGSYIVQVEGRGPYMRLYCVARNIWSSTTLLTADEIRERLR